MIVTSYLRYAKSDNGWWCDDLRAPHRPNEPGQATALGEVAVCTWYRVRRCLDGTNRL